MDDIRKKFRTLFTKLNQALLKKDRDNDNIALFHISWDKNNIALFHDLQHLLHLSYKSNNATLVAVITAKFEELANYVFKNEQLANYMFPKRKPSSNEPEKQEIQQTNQDVEEPQKSLKTTIEQATQQTNQDVEEPQKSLKTAIEQAIQQANKELQDIVTSSPSKKDRNANHMLLLPSIKSNNTTTIDANLTSFKYRFDFFNVLFELACYGKHYATLSYLLDTHYEKIDNLKNINKDKLEKLLELLLDSVFPHRNQDKLQEIAQHQIASPYKSAIIATLRYFHRIHGLSLKFSNLRNEIKQHVLGLRKLIKLPTPESNDTQNFICSLIQHFDKDFNTEHLEQLHKPQQKSRAAKKLMFNPTVEEIQSPTDQIPVSLIKSR